MKAFLRYVIFTSIVGAIAFVAIDGNVVFAAPVFKTFGQKAPRIGKLMQEKWKALRAHRRMLEEKETEIHPRQVEQERETLHPQQVEQTKEAVRSVEQEKETARSSQAETQQVVPSLLRQAEPIINDRLSAILPVLTQEQIKNIINEAVAKAAEVEASRPNPKFIFDASTRKLTFEKSWVIKGVKVRFEVNLSRVLKLAGGSAYVCIVVEQKKLNECIKDMFNIITDYVDKELASEMASAAEPPVETVARSTSIDSSASSSERKE
jgi:hypothetical protein